jgi:hypothetical protein
VKIFDSSYCCKSSIIYESAVSSKNLARFGLSIMIQAIMHAFEARYYTDHEDSIYNTHNVTHYVSHNIP